MAGDRLGVLATSAPRRSPTIRVRVWHRGAVRRTLEEVYDELAPAVRGYFAARGANDPDDLTGDVFVSVASGLSRFRGDDAALRRWAFTIAHHRLVDEYRSARRRREVPVGEPPEPDRTADRDAAPIDADLRAALDDLTDEQREVIVLRFVADLSLRDVARVLDRRTGAVKMLQSRGLERLRAAIGDDRAGA